MKNIGLAASPEGNGSGNSIVIGIFFEWLAKIDLFLKELGKSQFQAERESKIESKTLIHQNNITLVLSKRVFVLFIVGVATRDSGA